MSGDNFPDTTYEEDRPFLIEWFKTFVPPPHFKGGCMQARLKKYCYRIKPDGSIGKITENCENKQDCPGHRYDYE